MVIGSGIRHVPVLVIEQSYFTEFMIILDKLFTFSNLFSKKNF